MNLVITQKMTTPVYYGDRRRAFWTGEKSKLMTFSKNLSHELSLVLVNLLPHCPFHCRRALGFDCCHSPKSLSSRELAVSRHHYTAYTCSTLRSLTPRSGWLGGDTRYLRGVHVAQNEPDL